MDEILQEYVATANNPEYNSDWSVIDSKFPELSQYDKKLLQEYVATANNPEYNSDWDVINSKFPEFKNETVPVVKKKENLSLSLDGLSVTPSQEPLPEDKEVEEVSNFQDLSTRFKRGGFQALAGLAGVPNYINKLTASIVMSKEDLEDLNKLPAEAREAILAFSNPTQSSMVMASAEAQNYLTEKAENLAGKTIEFEGNIIDDIGKGDLGQASYRILQGVTESAPSLITAMVPGGLVAIGAGTASQKQEEQEREGEGLGFRQTLNSLVNGVAEGFFEKYTAGALGKIGKVFKGNKEIIEETSKNIIKTIAEDIGIEGLSESATAIAQELSDKFIAEKDISWISIIKNVIDAGIVGGAMGGGFGGIKGLASYTSTKTRSEETTRELNKNAEDVQKLRNELDANPSENISKALNDEISRLEKESVEIHESEVSKVEGLSNDKIKSVFEIDSKMQDLNQQLIDVVNDDSLSPETKTKLESSLREQFDSLAKNKQEVIDSQKTITPEKVEAKKEEIRSRDSKEIVEVNEAEATKQAVKELTADAEGVVTPEMIKERVEEIKKEKSTIQKSEADLHKQAIKELTDNVEDSTPETVEVIEDATPEVKQITDAEATQQAVKELSVDPEGVVTPEAIAKRAEEIKTGKTVRDEDFDNKTKENLRPSKFKGAKEVLTKIKEGVWGMLSAENPNAKQGTDVENKANNEKAKAWLKEKGYNVDEIFGKYDNSENSFFVDNLSVEDAIAFAKEFKQESVATNKGLVYPDGTINPIKKGSEQVGTKKDNYYSTIKTSEGNVDFSVDYDFNTKEKYVSEQTKTEQGPIQKQVENAKKAIKKLLPNVKIITHENPESYAEASGEKVSKGEGGFYNPNNGEIHINLKEANKRTVAHEVFHAVLMETFIGKKLGSNKATEKALGEVTDKMMRSLLRTTEAGSDLRNALRDLSRVVRDNYDSNVWNEEILAELTGLLANNYNALTKPQKTIIQKWLSDLAFFIGKTFNIDMTDTLEFMERADNDVIDFLNVIARKTAEGSEITSKDIEVISDGFVFEGEISEGLTPRKSKFIDNLQIDKLPTHKNVTVKNNFKLKDIEGQRASSTLSDKLIAGRVGTFRFLGGVGYPEATGRVWASSRKIDADKIINKIETSQDGFKYLAPAIMSNTSHMSNRNLSLMTIEIFKEAVANKEVNRAGFKEMINKTFNIKGLSKLKSEAVKSINGNVPVLKVIDNFGKFLTSDKLTFENRIKIIKSLVGDSASGKAKFKTLGTFTQLAKSLTDPIVKDAKLHQVVMIVRTKGELSTKKTEKTDEFYHESYPYHIDSSEKIEVLYLDGSYDLVDMFPEFTKKDGSKVSLENELKTKGDSFDVEFIRRNLGRTHGLSGYSSPIIAKRKQTGQQNAEFFTGKAQEASSKIPYKPVLKVDQTTPVAKSFLKFTDGGNFTGHISKMIAGFAEKQKQVAEAIVKGNFNSFLDIGSSEGGLIKTVGENAPDMTVVGIDPNPSMLENFNKTPKVKNVDYRLEALGASWTEADGTVINEFKPKQKFDVVNEDFTFQFINGDREAQVAQVKEVLNDEGIFITSEKMHTANSKKNEAKKYDHQRKYFNPDQLTEDKQTIITGMNDDMTNDVKYFNILKENFDNVAEFWNAGDFKGFIASNSKNVLDQFLMNVGDLSSEFTDKGSKTRDSFSRRKQKSDLSTQVQAGRDAGISEKSIRDYLIKKGFDKKTINLAITKAFIKSVDSKTKNKENLTQSAVGLKTAVDRIRVAYNQGAKDTSSALKIIKKEASTLIFDSLRGRVNINQVKSLITKVRDINEKNYSKKLDEIDALLDKISKTNQSTSETKRLDKVLKNVKKSNDKGKFSVEGIPDLRVMISAITSLDPREIPADLRAQVGRVLGSMVNYNKKLAQPMFDEVTEVYENLQDTFIDKAFIEETNAQEKLDNLEEALDLKAEKEAEAVEFWKDALADILAVGYDKTAFDDFDRALLFRLHRLLKSEDLSGYTSKDLRNITQQLTQTSVGENAWMPTQKVSEIVDRLQAEKDVKAMEKESFSKKVSDLSKKPLPKKEKGVAKEVRRYDNILKGYMSAFSKLFKSGATSYARTIGLVVSAGATSDAKKSTFAKSLDNLLLKMKGNQFENQTILSLYALQKRKEANPNNKNIFSAKEHKEAVAVVNSSELNAIFAKFENADGEFDVVKAEKWIDADKNRRRLVDFINIELSRSNERRKTSAKHHEGIFAEDIDWYTPVVVGKGRLSELMSVQNQGQDGSSIGSSNKDLKATTASPFNFDYFKNIKGHVNNSIEYSHMMPVLKQLEATERAMRTSSLQTVREDWSRILFGVDNSSGVVQRHFEAKQTLRNKRSMGQEFFDILANNKIKSLLLNFVTRAPIDFGANAIFTYGAYLPEITKGVNNRKKHNSGKPGILTENAWMDHIFSNYNSEQAGRDTGVNTSDVRGAQQNVETMHAYRNNRRTTMQYVADLLGHNKINRATSRGLEMYYSITDSPSMKIWKAEFSRVFPTFDVGAFTGANSLDYREQNEEKILEAIASADKLTRNLYNTPASDAEKNSTLVNKRAGAIGQAKELLLGFQYNENHGLWNAIHSMTPWFVSKKGDLPADQAIRNAFIITGRALLYTASQTLLVSALTQAITGIDDDELDEDLIVKRSLAQFGSLAFWGNKNAFSVMAYQFAFEMARTTFFDGEEDESLFYTGEPGLGNMGLTGMVVEDLMEVGIEIDNLFLQEQAKLNIPAEATEEQKKRAVMSHISAKKKKELKDKLSRQKVLGEVLALGFGIKYNVPQKVVKAKVKRQEKRLELIKKGTNK